MLVSRLIEVAAGRLTGEPLKLGTFDISGGSSNTVVWCGGR